MHVGTGIQHLEDVRNATSTEDAVGPKGPVGLEDPLSVR